MRIKIMMIAFVAMIMLVALACSLTPGGTDATPSDDVIATSVAQTLTASDGVGGDGGGSPSPSDMPVSPTDVPAPATPLHVVYVDDGELWMWSEAGGAVQLYSGEKVEKVILSPDTEVIAFTTIAQDFTTLGLWRIYVDGSGLQRLVSAADFDAIAASNPDAVSASPYLWQFIPGTHILAFNTQLQFEGPGLHIQNDIRHLDVDSGLQSIFLDTGQAGNFYYSPDGLKVAFTTSESVNLINADGTRRIDNVITFPFVITASEYSFYPVPVWTPDSSEFWVTIPPKDPFDTGPNNVSELFMVTSEGVPASFGPFPGDLSHVEAGEKIAPDGSAVAYYESSGSGVDLFIAEINGPDTPYAENITNLKGWAPDASHFVYQTTSGEIWVGEVGAPALLLDSWGGPGEVVFLQDGSFVFASGTFGNFTLRLGTVTGGNDQIASPTADFPQFDAAPRP